MEDKLLITEEVASILRCSPDQIWKLVREKKISHYRPGKRILFSHDHVCEYLKANEIKQNKKGGQ
jgi:excisionase family DNA binding protein